MNFLAGDEVILDKRELLNFLQKHRLGVQASVSALGFPQAAVVGIAVSDRFEIIFDTTNDTRKYSNLKANPQITFVIGWDEEQTVQYEGIAHEVEVEGEERNRVLEIYFSVYPDGRDRLLWPGIVHFCVKPNWIRYTDYRLGRAEIHLFTQF